MLTRSTHFEGTVFIHLTTKDQLTRKCADYLPKLISIYIKSSLLSLKLDFKMVSFILKLGNRHFSLCKLASVNTRLQRHFWKKQLLTLIKSDILAHSDVVVWWLSEGVINHTFPGSSSPASPENGVRLLKEICSFPMIPIKLSVSKMNDNTSLGRN